MTSLDLRLANTIGERSTRNVDQRANRTRRACAHTDDVAGCIQLAMASVELRLAVAVDEDITCGWVDHRNTGTRLARRADSFTENVSVGVLFAMAWLDDRIANADGKRCSGYVHQRTSCAIGALARTEEVSCRIEFAVTFVQLRLADAIDKDLARSRISYGNPCTPLARRAHATAEHGAVGVELAVTEIRHRFTDTIQASRCRRIIHQTTIRSVGALADANRAGGGQFQMTSLRLRLAEAVNEIRSRNAHPRTNLSRGAVAEASDLAIRRCLSVARLIDRFTGTIDGDFAGRRIDNTNACADFARRANPHADHFVVGVDFTMARLDNRLADAVQARRGRGVIHEPTGGSVRTLTHAGKAGGGLFQVAGLDRWLAHAVEAE
jgi:hypothetical protein